MFLNLSNVHSSSNALVIENTKGFILGCLMEKDVRAITRVEFNKNPSLKNDLEHYDAFNFPYHKHRSLSLLTQKLLLAKDCALSKQLRKPLLRSFNSLLIVHDQYTPLALFQSIELFLASNCSCVVFCLFLNPLRELQEYLKQSQRAIRVRVEELLTREIQVLPMRTHPMMNMHGTSGYLLSWITTN